MLYLFGTMALLQLSDGLMTYLMVGQGWVREINPLVGRFAGDAAFAFLKITGAIVCVALLWLVSKRFRLLAIAAAALIVVFYAVVLGWNVHTLLSLPRA